MSLALDLFDPSPEHWRLDDKEYVAKRKREWKSILPRINLLQSQSRLNKETLKEIKRYFFKGGEFPFQQLTAYWPDILLQCWLHPNPNLQVIVLNKKTKIFPLDWSHISLFFSEVWSKCSDVAEYGVMGGREYDMILFYNKGFDFQTRHDYGNGQDLAACFKPNMIGSVFFWSVKMELSLNENNKNYVAHTPGLALLDHFDYAMDTYQDAVFNNAIFEKMSERQLKNNDKRVAEKHQSFSNCLRSLLEFQSTSGFSELLDKRPASAQKITEFIERYEKRQFRGGLLDYLDKL